MWYNSIMHAGTVQSILNDAVLLPPDDRATLARALLDSVHGEVEPAVEEAWRADEVRRCASSQSNTGEALMGSCCGMKSRLVRRR